jgi:uncharacterized membrane protein
VLDRDKGSDSSDECDNKDMDGEKRKETVETTAMAANKTRRGVRTAKDNKLRRSHEEKILRREDCAKRGCSLSFIAFFFFVIDILMAFNVSYVLITSFFVYFSFLFFLKNNNVFSFCCVHVCV